tara:strand:- start:2495 stop:2713 length:219 start_codon:yes stop_codon:yes gene_type:complete
MIKRKKEKEKRRKMMNKNTVLGWATFLMIIFGLALIVLALTKYKKIVDLGFVVVGIGFFAIAWVFNALKGRV